MQATIRKNLQSWTNVPMSAIRFPLLVLLFVANTRGAGTTKAPGFVIAQYSDIEYGGTATLTCIPIDPNAASPSSYVWFKDNKIIPGETRGTLTLSSVTEQDAGIYQCGDPNSNAAMAEYDLHVPYPELPTPVVLPLSEADGDLGFALQCCLPGNFTGGHRIEYTWYKDDEEVAAHHADELWFRRVRETDAGNYTCTAQENPQQAKAPPSSPFILAPNNDDVRPSSSARVLRGKEGEKLTLTCEVSRPRAGVPADAYSWSRIGQDGRRRPLVGKARTLTLGPLTREDAGTYVCQAGNLQECRDGDLASFKVDVVYLKNIRLISDVEVKDGDTVILTCKVDSLPAARLAWIVHGQEVRHVTGNLDHYVIPRAGCSDSTNYTCRASNTDLPGREMSKSIRVHVQHCKEAVTEPGTSPSTTSAEPETKGEGLPSGALAGIVVSVIVVIVVFAVFINRRRACNKGNGSLGQYRTTDSKGDPMLELEDINQEERQGEI